MNFKGFVCGDHQTNCFVAWDDDKNCVLIDCNGSEMSEFIDKEGLNPKYILLTHGHGDHIGFVEYYVNKYNIPVVCGKNEAGLLADPSMNLSGCISITPDKLFEDGEVFSVGGMDFKIIFTPGHTAGSICYITGGELFSGDTLFWGSCGRVDFPSGNKKDMSDSLRLLKSLEKNYNVYPGHGQYTTLDSEKRNNLFMAHIKI